MDDALSRIRRKKPTVPKRDDEITAVSSVQPGEVSSRPFAAVNDLTDRQQQYGDATLPRTPQAVTRRGITLSQEVCDYIINLNPSEKHILRAGIEAAFELVREEGLTEKLSQKTAEKLSQIKESYEQRRKQSLLQTLQQQHSHP